MNKEKLKRNIKLIADAYFDILKDPTVQGDNFSWSTFADRWINQIILQLELEFGINLRESD